MWLGIGYTIPQSGDVNTGGGVGSIGDVEVIMESGSTVIFANAATGSFLPILVKQVLAANTTASNLLALF
jgi:hypothetical protein